MSREQLYITPHAIRRFQERIDPGISEGSAVMEMLRCLLTAKDKDLTRKRLNKNTHYITTDRCMMICSWGRIVTVIPRRVKVIVTQ